MYKPWSYHVSSQSGKLRTASLRLIIISVYELHYLYNPTVSQILFFLHLSFLNTFPYRVKQNYSTPVTFFLLVVVFLMLCCLTKLLSKLKFI